MSRLECGYSYGEKMEKIRFQIREKELTLYPAQGEDRPLIVFNTVMGDGEELARALRELKAPDCNLLVVGKLQWYHDMTLGAEPRKSLPGRGDAKRKRHQSDTGSVIASGSPRLEITGMMQEKYGM